MNCSIHSTALSIPRLGEKIRAERGSIGCKVRIVDQCADALNKRLLCQFGAWDVFDADAKFMNTPFDFNALPALASAAHHRASPAVIRIRIGISPDL